MTLLLSKDRGDDSVKVAFPLIRDEKGWPPADWEHMWAIPLHSGEFQLDNIPFFAQGIACGDRFVAKRQGQKLIFDRVSRSSGHSTIRVIVYDPSMTQAARDTLLALGCESEGSHVPHLFAVDIPPDAEYQRVIDYLAEQTRAGVLEHEEGVIRHPDTA